MLIALNKPYGVLCQLNVHGGASARDRPRRAGARLPQRPSMAGSGRRTLAEFVRTPGVYPAGRLDFDSEGLVLLTDDGALAHRLTDPRRATEKTYLVQVEGTPTGTQLSQLQKGILLHDGPTLPARARLLQQAPGWLWPRDPPVRFRKTVPDAWIELTIREGRNRQVRRMTAAVGLPTLRLIRARVGAIELDGLAPGEMRSVGNDQCR
jgi:23S rRNA pseudouridine2457 synthase